MRKTLTILLTLSLHFVFAQTGKITGQLINSKDNAPVPFSNVILYNANDSLISGTFTSEEGEFKFTDVPYGNYYITSESLTHKNYKSEVISISSKEKWIKLGVIHLQQNVITTDVVEISVDKPAVKIEPAKKTFDVKSTGADIGGTAADVLNNLPSVDIGDNGEVSLRGNSNIRVLIDGKPAGVNADDINLVINQLPANSIETIEVITVPSAKYDPEGVGGIINIVLKKQRKKGYHGGVNVAYSTADKINFNTSLSLNKKKWHLGINYSYTDGTYWKKRTNDAVKKDNDSTTTFLNHQYTTYRRPNHIVKLNTDYNLSKRSKLSWDVTLNHMESNVRDSSYLYWDYNKTSTEEYNRFSSTSSSRINLNNQINFSTKTKNGIKVDLFTRQRGFHKPQTGEFTELTSLEKEERLFTSFNVENQLDIYIPIRKKEKDTINNSYFNIEMGLKSANRNFNEDYDFFEFSPSLNQFETNDDFNQLLKYDEGIYAGYAMVNLGNKSYQITGGLRAEHTSLSSETKTQTISNSFFNLFPTFSIVKNFNEYKSLSLAYSKRIKRPRGQQLNPIPSFSNPFNLHVGNAALLPEISHMTELSFLTIGDKLTYNTTLFYQYRDNRLGRLSYTDTTGVSVVLWYNFNYHQTFGWENFANFKFNKWLKLNSSLTLYQTWVDGSSFNTDYKAQYFGYDAKLNFQFKFSEKLAGNITGNYNSERLAVVGPVLPRYAADIAVKYKVLKDKGNISVRYSDVFQTRQFGIDVITDGWERAVRYKGEWSLIWFGFNYNFGQASFNSKK